MKDFPFINSRQALVLLRIVVALLFLLHGIGQLRQHATGGTVELINGAAPAIGSFLNTLLAVFEITGGVLMGLGYYLQLITLLFIIEILLWFVLYAMSGWYALGYQNSSVWYSILLIVCLLVIAAAKKK